MAAAARMPSSPVRATLADLVRLRAAGEAIRLTAPRIRVAASGGHLSPYKGRGVEFDESRPYQPHLTLARSRTPTDLRPVIAALGDAPFGPSWTIDTLTVYESKTQRDGAQYTPRATIALAADSAR